LGESNRELSFGVWEVKKLAEEGMMKKILGGVSVILLVALVAVSAFFISSINQQRQISQQVSTQISDLQQKASKLETDKSTLDINVGKITQERDALSAKVTQLEDGNKTLNDKLSGLTKDLDQKTSDWQKANSEVAMTKSKYMCKDTLTGASFLDNESVNKSLVDYVNGHNNLDLPITAHYWNVIWTGSKYSTHTIEIHSEKDRTNYLWKFTVYFKGESFGDHVNGIFYNDDQCWLYLDK
jgi:outer membrane murein-binding lipoprotein Lpp